MNRFAFRVLLVVGAGVPGAVAQSPPLVVASLFNESTSMPYTRFVTTPVHPGIQLGTEFKLREGRGGRMYLGAHGGYFHHDHLAQGFYLGSELGYAYRTAIGTSVGASLGLGYLRTYVTGPEFVFANGSYHRRPDTGNGRMMPSFSLEIGQHLRKEHYAPQLFVRYQTWLEYPYSPGFIELMSHTSLHVGYRFLLRSSTNIPSIATP